MTSSSSVVLRVTGLGKSYRQAVRRRPYNLRERLASLGRLARAKRQTGPRDTGRTPFWALRGVTFEVSRGETVGIVGRNGSGKSTLLRIIAGITRPTEGSVEIAGRVAPLLEVGTGFHSELTGRENVFLNGAILGMRASETRRRFEEIVAFAEVGAFLDTPVKHYSTGMYMRLAFAVAAHLDAPIVLIDEILAVGDVAFQRKCLAKMQSIAGEGRTILFVSHNMAAIDSLCTVGLYLEQGRDAEVVPVRRAIERYFGNAPRGSVTFHEGAVREASVVQEGNAIVIRAVYSVGEPLRIPCLGFVISDATGAPICGTNPLASGITSFPKPVPAGTVEVRMHQPRLLDGLYSLSLWLGDGHSEVFAERDCLRFVVSGMARGPQLSSEAVGAVSPECSWSFQP